MDKLVRAWGAEITKKLSSQFISPAAPIPDPKDTLFKLQPLYTGSNIDIEALLDWIQKEVTILIFDHVGAGFWSHFEWFTFAAVTEEEFDDKLEKCLLEACAELVKIKLLVMAQFEAICEEPMVQAIFAAPDVQRRFVRTLQFMETIWHLVVLPIPGMKLRPHPMEGPIRSGLWRKLLFHFFARQFDRMQARDQENAEASMDSADNEPPEAFVELVQRLNVLSLVDITSDVIQALLRDRIQKRMVSQAELNEEPNQLDTAKTWVEMDCLSFLARVLVPSLDIGSLKEKLDSIEKSYLEKPENLRGSQDSDLEDSFVFKPGTRRVPSTPMRNTQPQYVSKDTLSAIKKLQTQPRHRLLEGHAEGSSSEELSDSDSDDDFLSRQLNFGTAAPTQQKIGEPSSTVSSPIGRMSPIRPGSPGSYRVPASPIPFSAVSSIDDWMLKNSVNSATQKDARMRQLCNWRAQLFRFLFETVASIHIRRLFDLIVDYPNSQPALLDLKTCLEATQQYGELIASLGEAFHRRLLHPGASTSDIVTVYIATIRAIREIDPSNVLLALVTVDLRAYLSQRPDSLRALVSLLTEDGGESGISLISELEDSSTIKYDGNDIDVDSDEDDGPIGASKEDWNPAPIIRAPSLSSTTSSHLQHHLTRGDHTSPSAPIDFTRAKDLISMLISIHGSKDNFLAEYAHLLASRLLNLSDFAAEAEVKNVELLKLKFGEPAMLQCEVMLKDLAQSKRFNTTFQRALADEKESKMDESAHEESEKDETEATVAIFSHLFWPSNYQPLTVALPHELQRQRELMEKTFTSLKSSRVLMWYDSMGTVEVELCLAPPASEDGEDAEPEAKTFTVTPLQAAIIVQFEQSERITLEQLTTQCKIPEDVVKRGLALWLGNGVVKEIGNDTYLLADSLEATDEVEFADPNAADDEEEQIDDDDYIPFIKAMLKQKPLSLAGIHAKLTQFKEEYSLTLQQLSDLLDRMQQKEHVELKSGVFGLVK